MSGHYGELILLAIWSVMGLKIKYDDKVEIPTALIWELKLKCLNRLGTASSPSMGDVDLRNFLWMKGEGGYFLPLMDYLSTAWRLHYCSCGVRLNKKYKDVTILL